jgi:RHS repeat-associated protein
MIEPGRKFVQGAKKYRYGFNGKENDNEVKGEGNQQDYGMRIYDPRLGRFLSEDPITSKYPELTPYQFASNRPIDGIDLDGLEFFSYKWYMGQTPLRILTREGAKTLINKPIALAFKQAFSTELPKKFIDRYASESGKPYKLNNKELEGLHVTHVGLHGGTKKSIKTANDFLSSIKPGESKELPKGFSIGDAAGEAGTLGRFTIKLKGTVEKDKDGNWTFKGQMQFYDVYDFKTKKPKKGQTEEGLERNASADKQTEFADNYLPGKGFKITSDWIPVEQNSKKDDFFDWFKGKSQEPKDDRY